MWYALQMEGQNIFIMGRTKQEAEGIADLLWSDCKYWIVNEHQFLEIYEDQKRKGKSFTQIKVKPQMIVPSVVHTKCIEMEEPESVSELLEEYDVKVPPRFDLSPKIWSPSIYKKN